MNVLDFIRDAATLKPSPVYLFCPGKAGPRAKITTYEPFLVERALDQYTALAVDEASREFAYAAFYADETPPGTVVMEAQTLPFLADRRIIVVRNAERYSAESGSGAMLAYLESPNESSTLLLVSDKVDRRTKFFKACEKAGVIVECPELDPKGAIQWVRTEARARNAQFTDGAIHELVRRAGNRLGDVNNALTNVINFVGDAAGTIGEETVVRACADVAEEEIWALTDAIASSRAGAALMALRRLIDLGKHPDEMIGTINWLLKNAYLVATAPGNPAISPFVATKVRPLAEKLGVAKLRAAFALCTESQFMMRDTGSNGNLLIELLVVKLAHPAPRRKSA